MTMNPDDPRVKKSRQALRDALVRLIPRDGYDAISIQDIATEARSSRMTFYRHYRDKEELLTDCLNILYAELSSRTERLSPQAVLDGYSPMLALYEHMEEQADLYRILFSSVGAQTVVERLRHHLAQRSLESIRLSARTPRAGIPAEIIAYHTASAQLGLAIWWFDHDRPYPASYMARVSLWLSLSGLLETLGVTDFKPPAPLLETSGAV